MSKRVLSVSYSRLVTLSLDVCMYLSVCVCVCVCACVCILWVNVYYRVTTFLKQWSYIESKISSSMSRFSPPGPWSFQYRTFWHLIDLQIFRKRGEIQQSLGMPSHMKPCIWHRMAQMRMLYTVTLTYIFKVTKCEMWISRKQWKLTKNVHFWIL